MSCSQSKGREFQSKGHQMWRLTSWLPQFQAVRTFGNNKDSDAELVVPGKSSAGITNIWVNRNCIIQLYNSSNGSIGSQQLDQFRKSIIAMVEAVGSQKMTDFGCSNLPLRYGHWKIPLFIFTIISLGWELVAGGSFNKWCQRAVADFATIGG